MCKNVLNLMALCWCACLVACASSPPAQDSAEHAQIAGERLIVVDGRTEDWPENVSVLADEDFVYFRLSTGDDSSTLQASDESLVILLDIDNDANTGDQRDDPSDASGMGIDIEIHLSPIDEDGSIGLGTRIIAIDSVGNRLQVSWEDVDFHFSPTASSRWYEARISRHLGHVLGLPQPGLTGAGRARGLYMLVAPPSEVLGWSDPFVIDLPPAAGAAPLSEAEIPPKPDGCIRIMSYNVLRSKPMTETGPFSHVFQVVDPDVILVQEWDEPAETLISWFTALVPSPTGWHARTCEAWGVGIISKYPIRPLGPDRIVVDGQERPVRFVGGVIDTPVGELATGSLHLKCCGRANSSEDKLRLAEAQLINKVIRESLSSGGATIRVFAGDFNLVGSFPPLDAVRDGLDAGGASLVVAQPGVIGDASFYTWRGEADDRFSPGRLDYIVYGEARADVVNVFVIDNKRLSDQSLGRMGLYRDDTGGSDHMPLVIDIRPTR